jgi:hypothetical protein
MSRNRAHSQPVRAHVCEIERGALAGSLLSARAMRSILIWCLLVGCGGSDNTPDPCSQARFGVCSDGLQCTYPDEDGGRDTTCDCQGSFFVCNSCPSEFSPPSGACTPGDACEWNSWEHGCSCGCGDDGQWSCAPQTIGTTEC